MVVQLVTVTVSLSSFVMVSVTSLSRTSQCAYCALVSGLSTWVVCWRVCRERRYSRRWDFTVKWLTSAFLALRHGSVEQRLRSWHSRSGTCHCWWFAAWRRWWPAVLTLSNLHTATHMLVARVKCGCAMR